MSIQGISGVGAYAAIAANYRSSAQQRTAAAMAAATANQAATTTTASDPVQEFRNYMKETPAQRLEDSWLAAHHLTRQQYEAMSPQERQAIQQQMASELKEQVKQAALDKPGKKGGIVV
jgi:hypothetical protein